ncbi:hypothetical protein BDZ89DRAFT_1138845 [Hymenopellis radicata]|nr:hypothetical protein BDZ89DRAFT_1138845 [Hymenopellis radicata]
MFLDWVQDQQNVWIVSTEQLVAWVQDPTPVVQLDNFNVLRCSTPDVQENICNGMPERENGQAVQCTFPDSFLPLLRMPILTLVP